MLSDLNEADHALAITLADPDDKNTVYTLKESYERVAEGIYEVDYLFDILGRNIPLTDRTFHQIHKDYWDKVNALGMKHINAFDSPEHTLLREEYQKASEEQSKNFPHDYGVCDYPEQVLEKFPKLAEDPRRFMITCQRVTKSSQEDGGWRWHKWGEYIGDKNPKSEYLKDEDDSISEVYIFHVLQLRTHA